MGGEEGAEGGGAEGVAGECCERSLFSGDLFSLDVSLMYHWKGWSSKGDRESLPSLFKHNKSNPLNTPACCSLIPNASCPNTCTSNIFPRIQYTRIARWVVKTCSQVWLVQAEI